MFGVAKLAVDLFKLLVKYPLTAVTERSMSDIVAQRYCSYEIGVEVQCVSDGRSDIVNVDNVLKSGTDVIVRGIEEDLRLVL